MNKKKTLRTILLTLVIFAAILFFIVFALYQFHLHQKHAQEPISMILATDMHVLASDYTGSYFYEPQSFFDGKVIHYSNEFFDAFLEEVLQNKPEILILSGDLTLNGSVKSHTDFIDKIQQVQAAGIEVLVIPGNHDVDSSAWDYTNVTSDTPSEEVPLVESLTSVGFMELYENFGPAQALSRDENTFSYIYEATPYLRILMLDTNCFGKGYVKDETLEWLEKELLDAKLADAEVLAITHQNLYAHNSLLSFGYQLYNADELLALYEKYDVICNLSGHIHVQSIMNEKVPEIATASMANAGTQYGLITYDGQTLEYTLQQTDVNGYAAKHNLTNEDLLNYDAFSRTYFKEISELSVYNSYAESALSQEELALLAQTYSSINLSYFLGDAIDTDMLSDGIALWRTQESSFILRYIESMLEEAQTNNRNMLIQLD